MEKNLQQEEALKKYRKLVDEVGVCMFITDNHESNHTRPMAVIETEDNGTLWVYTDIRSIKVEEVNQDHQVHLVRLVGTGEPHLDEAGLQVGVGIRVGLTDDDRHALGEDLHARMRVAVIVGADRSNDDGERALAAGNRWSLPPRPAEIAIARPVLGPRHGV